jgi:hypothetical protein
MREFESQSARDAAVVNLRVKRRYLQDMKKDREVKAQRKRMNSGLILELVSSNINSVALVRERTIPTERPPLVNEVSAIFCGCGLSRDQHNGFI